MVVNLFVVLLLVVLVTNNYAVAQQFDVRKIGVTLTESSVNFDNFTTVTDHDGSTFSLKKLNLPTRRSCYELKKNEEITRFCYPSIHIAGIAKCGTSAVYAFLANRSEYIKPAHHLEKEYCPYASYYEYFKGMKNTFKSLDESIEEQKLLYVNGCIHPHMLYVLHKLLVPNAVYIVSVRHFAERTWASYNFWCNELMDAPCKAGDWTNNKMYRSPAELDQILRAANFPNRAKSRNGNFQMTCTDMHNYYLNILHPLQMVGHVPPLIVSIDALSSPQHVHQQMHRMEAYLNSNLGIALQLNETGMAHVNAGNKRGMHSVQTTDSSGGGGGSSLLRGTYKMSKFQPMLESTTAYINSCWKECKEISVLSDYAYNCSSVILQTGGNFTTDYLEIMPTVVK